MGIPESGKHIFYRGRAYTIELARLSKGSCPSKEFFDQELTEGERAKIFIIIKWLADNGEVRNREKFKKIEGTDFFEFKSGQIRIPCYFKPGSRVVLTHGFKKKQDRINPSQIERMERIRREYEDEGK